MEEQHRHEIAARLRQLRDNSEQTNRSIAERCGVGERTVAGWASPTNPTGMSYKNAKKVAAIFDADVDWLWRGRPKGDTPDLFASPQLDRIEGMVTEILDRLDVLDAKRAAAEIDRPDVEVTPRSREAGRGARDR